MNVPLVRMTLRFAPALMLALLLLIPSGCVQTTTTAKPHSGFEPGELESMKFSTGEPVTPETLTAKDRCPARLHDIAGALLDFYVDHGTMASSLDELKSYIPNVPLVCPDSNKPYVYIRAGLQKPGGTKRLVVFDPVMNADGTRWCVLIGYTPQGKPQETEVVQLTEPLFRAYQ